MNRCELCLHVEHFMAYISLSSYCVLQQPWESHMMFLSTRNMLREFTTVFARIFLKAPTLYIQTGQHPHIASRTTPHVRQRGVDHKHSLFVSVLTQAVFRYCWCCSCRITFSWHQISALIHEFWSVQVRSWALGKFARCLATHIRLGNSQNAAISSSF